MALEGTDQVSDNVWVLELLEDVHLLLQLPDVLRNSASHSFFLADQHLCSSRVRVRVLGFSF